MPAVGDAARRSRLRRIGRLAVAAGEDERQHRGEDEHRGGAGGGLESACIGVSGRALPAALRREPDGRRAPQVVFEIEMVGNFDE